MEEYLPWKYGEGGVGALWRSTILWGLEICAYIFSLKNSARFHFDANKSPIYVKYSEFSIIRQCRLVYNLFENQIVLYV